MRFRDFMQTDFGLRLKGCLSDAAMIKKMEGDIRFKQPPLISLLTDDFIRLSHTDKQHVERAISEALRTRGYVVIGSRKVHSQIKYGKSAIYEKVATSGSSQEHFGSSQAETAGP